MKTETSTHPIPPNRQASKRVRIATGLAWIGLALALACGAAELLAGPGYRLGWWQFGAGIQIIRWAATTDLGAVVNPEIATTLLDVPPADALRRAERAARAMGWDIVAVSSDDLRIEAIATTLLFGFKDDIVIRVTANGPGSRVDMRSLSRVGSSDLGVNAKRIRSFMKELAG